MARATATRCCCPPESCRGKCVARPVAEVDGLECHLAPCGARSARDSSFVSSNGSSTFSRAVSTGTRLYCWNTKPTCWLRQLARAHARRVRATSTCPRPRIVALAVGVSIPARRCSSVVLPLPLGPHEGHELTTLDLEIEVTCSGVTDSPLHPRTSSSRTGDLESGAVVLLHGVAPSRSRHPRRRRGSPSSPGRGRPRPPSMLSPRCARPAPDTRRARPPP